MKEKSGIARIHSRLSSNGHASLSLTRACYHSVIHVAWTGWFEAKRLFLVGCIRVCVCARSLSARSVAGCTVGCQ